MKQAYPLLDRINSIADLKALAVEDLPQLCDELRHFLISSISQSSGHFASNLGTVELTVALHYVYSSPEDKILWDVGHQAYAHKVLTGRKDQLHTIRQYQGVHPFPFRAESEHDILSVGHSSTSISAAVGISLANRLQGLQQDVVPIIGDGAMTAGMAFEALNHAGDLKIPLTIVFNDNNMSISENIGALNRHTSKIFNSELYQTFREKSKDILPQALKGLLKSGESAFKQFLSSDICNLYRGLGIEYLGPFDGHNVVELVKEFKRLKHNGKLQIVHVLTTKGKGYLPAEQDPIKYHAVGKFTPDYTQIVKNVKTAPQAVVTTYTNQETNKETVKENKPLTYSEVFGNWLVEHAQDPQLVAITPAMTEGSGMAKFKALAPQKLYDVAIAEQHAVTLATGLAIGNMHPVVAIYSTFLQRAYDQVIHDVALDNLPVLFAIDRAGIVGEDGQTHQGAFDLSYLRCIPNMVIACASSKQSLTQLLEFGYNYNGTYAVRYPRGQAWDLEHVDPTLRSTLEQDIVLGKGIKVVEANPDLYRNFTQEHNLTNSSKGIVILSFGTMLQRAISLAQQIGATVYDMRFVKPLDLEIIDQLSAYDLVVTLEENAISGGAGTAVLEAMQVANIQVPSLNLGISDNFVVPINTHLIEEVMAWTPEQIKQQIITKLQACASSTK
ncbi:1-deoxy-D-xylulose-5-phosphate synthase [Psittacicella hinzii]|uniref:1-deoxy-D-xylulose-5-phosphate synthase n=1 Tax=Psittacicella hinzii TaxID=2028575 RepID=A0A3A1YPH1_9GAMM|nr:1-deoxy-D-xylulose-5-phosphate synthase [Psittacicella hinzii]RIY40183.1 1-deoxy-D-xylulose-5-phosphate synthase [Psittacicella hinzii]